MQALCDQRQLVSLTLPGMQRHWCSRTAGPNPMWSAEIAGKASGLSRTLLTRTNLKLAVSSP